MESQVREVLRKSAAIPDCLVDPLAERITPTVLSAIGTFGDSEVVAEAVRIMSTEGWLGY